MKSATGAGGASGPPSYRAGLGLAGHVDRPQGRRRVGPQVRPTLIRAKPDNARCRHPDLEGWRVWLLRLERIGSALRTRIDGCPVPVLGGPEYVNVIQRRYHREDSEYLHEVRGVRE